MAQPAEASLTPREHSVDGRALGNSASTQLFVTAFHMADEDRLGAIRSTVAALNKVRYLSPAGQLHLYSWSIRDVAGRGGG